MEFPFQWLEAFGNNQTTLKRLRKGDTNYSDIAGVVGEGYLAVLQRNNIHLATCGKGLADDTLAALRASPVNAKFKVKFILATDGEELVAEDCNTGYPLHCKFTEIADNFGFFLPLAGIIITREIKNNPVDIRATSRLNRLYTELIEHNPDWTTDARIHDMNQFMARIIFCFFAEDTGIFEEKDIFTDTINKMSNDDNTEFVIGELFRAMNTPKNKRAKAKLPKWADVFPYVNGDLFSGVPDIPKFNRAARSYLLGAGGLDWKAINPDIFGSMIQAVAEKEERGALGMHYTSVPNILKVLEPLFLDNLKQQLERAGNNSRKLSNLQKRLTRIRVFDPACGSGNFLVIAYKEMRAIEAEINERRGKKGTSSQIPITNFRGIEIRDFPAQIARLALIIAEYQCDIMYREPKIALAEFLPLDKENWITCGNALRLNWLKLCPPTGEAVSYVSEELFRYSDDKTEIDFANEGGETYICGNPPYKGSTYQTAEQKDDLKFVFEPYIRKYKLLDYVACWFMKAAEYGSKTRAASAFVATNSICQGQSVVNLWPLIFKTGHEISFAHTSFKWSNLASHNAGVVVVVIGISNHADKVRRVFSIDDKGKVVIREAENINAYLIPGENIIVEKSTRPISDLPEMDFGSKPVDGGNLLLSMTEVRKLGLPEEQKEKFIRRFLGAEEFTNGKIRYCLWIEDEQLEEAISIEPIKSRIDKVREMRLNSSKSATNALAQRPHQFGEIRIPSSSGANAIVHSPHIIIVSSVSSENRYYHPVGLLPEGTIVSNAAFTLYDSPLWAMALIASRLHLVWIDTVCGKLGNNPRYSNTMGWNTFPVPMLTRQNKADMTECAENILLARERHFPKTIADLYSPGAMPENLRYAHDQNDEIIERIYIGRLFKNDTERLEKLFASYTEMTQ